MNPNEFRQKYTAEFGPPHDDAIPIMAAYVASDAIRSDLMDAAIQVLATSGNWTHRKPPLSAIKRAYSDQYRMATGGAAMREMRHHRRRCEWCSGYGWLWGIAYPDRDANGNETLRLLDPHAATAEGAGQAPAGMRLQMIPCRCPIGRAVNAAGPAYSQAAMDVWQGANRRDANGDPIPWVHDSAAAVSNLIDRLDVAAGRREAVKADPEIWAYAKALCKRLAANGGDGGIDRVAGAIATAKASDDDTADMMRNGADT